MMGKKPISKQDSPRSFLNSSPFGAGLTATVAFSFYLYHSAPGVTAEDSGDFHLGARTLGVIHPPGYPLYTILAHLAARLPLIDPAFAINALSALFAALAAGGLVLLVERWFEVPRKIGAVAAAAFVLHPVIWSQAVVAEVYTLNLFLTVAALGLAQSWRETGRARSLNLLGLVAGLALANHYPLFILGFGSFAVWLVREKKRHGKLPGARQWPAAAACFIAGLSPYMLLIVNALYRDPAYNFGKLSSLEMVWQHIMRFHYRGIDEAGGTLGDKVALLGHAEWRILLGFLAFAPLAAWGARELHARQWAWRRPLLASLLLTSAGLALLLGFPDNDRYRAIFTAYLGPAVLFHAFYLAVGLAAFVRVKSQALRVPMVILMISAVMAQGWLAYPSSSHRRDDFVARWSRAVLESLDPNAILILCGTDVLAVYYTHLVDGVRPDVTLYDRFSIFTRENLYGPPLLFQTQNPIAVRDAKERILADGARPVYYLCPEAPQESKIPVTPAVYGFRVKGGSAGASDAATAASAAANLMDEKLFASAISGLPRDEYWLDKRRIVFLYQAASYAAAHQPELLPRILDWLMKSKYIRNYEFTLAVAKSLLDNKRQPETLSLLTEKENQFGRAALHAEELSVYCGLELARQNSAKAEELCQAAAKKAPNCLAAVHVNLALIYRQKNQPDLLRQQAEAALACNPSDPIARQLLGQ
jgi:hypothetical protein